MNKEVKGVFEQYPENTRDKLLALRKLIFEVAADHADVGPLEETLKWGQISYLNPAGTTLRIDTIRDSPEQIAMYVHCRTNIVETLREQYAGVLEFEGNRCIKLPENNSMPVDELRDCILLALTYHLT